MSETVSNALVLISHNGNYLALFLLALFIMLLAKKKETNLFVLFCTLGLLVLVLPYSSDLIAKLVFEENKYYMNFALLPMMFAIAYAVIYLLKIQKGALRKGLLGICLIALVLLSGKLPYTNSSYMKTSNMEKLSVEADQIFNVIMSQNEKEKALIAPDEVLELAESEYPSMIRIPYSVGIMQNVVEKEKTYDTVMMDLYDMVNFGEGGIGKVVMRAREYRYPYIVFSNSFESEWPMTNGGYEKVLETEHYILYVDSSM